MDPRGEVLRVNEAVSVRIFFRYSRASYRELRQCLGVYQRSAKASRSQKESLVGCSKSQFHNEFWFCYFICVKNVIIYLNSS